MKGCRRTCGEKRIEKGRKEGIEQGKIQLIRGMHNNGVSIEDISKFTKSSLENIRRFLQG